VDLVWNEAPALSWGLDFHGLQPTTTATPAYKLQHMDVEFLTIAQASERLGVSPWSGRRLARARELPIVRRGRRILVPRRALERWLEAQADDALDAMRIGALRRKR
jgi:excisionase family DNA binding protein